MDFATSAAAAAAVSSVSRPVRSTLGDLENLADPFPSVWARLYE